MIADQRTTNDIEDFVFFPFTHPSHHSSSSNSSSGKKLSAISRSGFGKFSVVENRDIEQKWYSMVEGTERMRKYDDEAFGTPAPRTVDQPWQYEQDHDEGDRSADDDVLERDVDAEWKEKAVKGFLAAEQERSNSLDFFIDDKDNTPAAALSRESMLVQVGLPDMYKLEIEKLTKALGEVALGPVPSVINEEEMAPIQNSNSNQGISKVEVNASPKGHILMMITNMGMNRTQVQNQQRAAMLMNALHIPYETIDGSDPANKDSRNALFKLSDMRGMYPQFFVVSEGDNGDPHTTFLGDWETVEGINDSSSLPDELLEANPTLLTWDRVPGLVIKK